MGLDIIVNHAESYHVGSYGQLHRYRAMALYSTGDFSSYNDAYTYLFDKKKTDEQWIKYPEFYHFLHFSDCEGVYIPNFFLENINYKKSFVLSNSDELLEELRLIRRNLTTKNLQIDDDRISKGFYEFLELLESQFEEQNSLYIQFH